jgi:hypothetical protein
MLLGVVTFGFVAYLANLRALPRYFIVTTFAGTTLIAVATTHVLLPRRRWAAAAVCAALLGSNALLILVSNRDPLFGERALAAFAAGTDEVVYTDPHTLGRSRRFLRWAGVDPDERVRSEPPQPGALYFYHSRGAAKGRVHWLDTFEAEDYFVQDGWTEIWSRTPEERLAGKLLRFTHLDEALPAGIVERICQPNPPVSAWRVE